MANLHFPQRRFSGTALLAAVLLCGSLFAMLVAAQQTPIERFDNQVRGDMFAGLAGDPAAMDRAMKLCEEARRNKKSTSRRIRAGQIEMKCAVIRRRFPRRPSRISRRA
jgi:hypothetical protein